MLCDILNKSRMKIIIPILLLFNILISCGQNQIQKKKLEIYLDDIEFSSILLTKPIEGIYNQVEIRQLNKNQIVELAKTINNSKPRGMCKLGSVYSIKTYLKNDSLRVFRGNNNTIKEETDFCFTLPNETFYATLWNNSDTINIDYSKIVILPFNDFNFNMFENKKEAKLTNVELKEIEIILQNKLDFKQLLNLDKYFRQYVSVFNKNNEKEVWINFFCDTNNSEWRKERTIVKDGGNCYFNLKLNLKTRRITEIFINGKA